MPNRIVCYVFSASETQSLGQSLAPSRTLTTAATAGLVTMDAPTRKRLIEEHLDAIRDIEAQTVPEGEAQSWPPDRFYLLWHVVIGMMLGALGALVSLASNVLAAPLFGQRRFELIRVYLTFPMGARALEIEEGSLLMIGSVLYIVTGALYGILFHLVWTLYLRQASRGRKLLYATLMGLAIWIVNFYLVLSWLQPMMLGDNWIVRLVPLWVGALTHLAFAWTIAVGEIWGKFEAYKR